MSENFVHILTHNNLKIAFRSMEELEKYVYENKLNKAYVMSVQYHKDELVDKATPKKVVKYRGYNCPNCNMELLSGHDLAKENINFCFECGQKLVWSGGEP